MSKTSQTQRWAKIALRTGHLIGICGVAGGILLAQPWQALTFYWLVAICSGVAMIILDAINNWLWLVQLRGLVILFKLILLLLLGENVLANQLIMISIIILSGAIAHAPGNVRYFSVMHGRRVDSPHDTKG
ncbi:MAG: hypothetical protein H6999_07550 [Hahellaceae bacterium]|nr:hypothetical protein [Hahellaceae bacterium]